MRVRSRGRKVGPPLQQARLACGQQSPGQVRTLEHAQGETRREPFARQKVEALPLLSLQSLHLEAWVQKTEPHLRARAQRNSAGNAEVAHKSKVPADDREGDILHEAGHPELADLSWSSHERARCVFDVYEPLLGDRWCMGRCGAGVATGASGAPPVCSRTGSSSTAASLCCLHDLNSRTGSSSTAASLCCLHDLNSRGHPHCRAPCCPHPSQHIPCTHQDREHADDGGCHGEGEQRCADGRV